MATLRAACVFGLTLLLVVNKQVNCVSEEEDDDQFTRHLPACSIDTERMLAALNSYRDFHSSPHLEWSSKLASDARRSANELSRRVSCNLPLYYRDEIGTNYVASDVASFTEELAARFWYEGHSDYDFQEGGPENRNPNVLSFTQLVWKSSKDVGCGVACCDKERLILVCRFHPAGNIQGYYTQNVLEKFDRLKDVLPGEDADL